MTRYAIRYLKELKKKYGKGKERKTEISRSEDGELVPFDKIVASQVVVANETLYLNRKDGFAGYSLKKDEAIEKCSTLDDVIVFGKDGVMKVMKIADKMFVGKSPLRVSVFRRDDPKVYNMVYRDGKSGRLYAKKFKIGGVTRDKEYPLFKTHSKSRIFFFAVHDSEKKNSNILVHLDPELKRVREKVIEFDFAWLEIQGRGVKGSTLTAHKVDRVVNAPRENGEEPPANEGKEPEQPENPEPPKPAEKKAEPSKKEPEPVAAKEPVKKADSEEPAPKQGKDQVTFDFEGN
jgi:topoisomerase-4 subunit A